MRRYSMFFAVACLVSALLAPGAGRAQSTYAVVAWGYNYYGACNVPSPNEGYVTVAGGDVHTLGLKSDGTIVAWGYNYYHQCNVPSPNADFVAVAAGYWHSLGLKLDSTIVAWGDNSNGQCTVPSPNADFVAAAGGWYHSMGLKSDSTIVAWGSNAAGQCNVPSPNADFVVIAASLLHSLGLKSDSTIAAWGDNNYGQSNVPSPNADFVAVAAGYWHSLGLKSDGTIVTWGDNSFGQCDVPSPNADFVAVTGGYTFSLGLKSDGTIVAWGRNVEGQCNVPSPNGYYVAVSAGSGHGLALREPCPICVVSPGSIDFGTVLVAEHKDTTFVIRNIGDATLSGSVSETYDHFSIVSGEGAYSINPGDSIIVTVRFEPTSGGAHACEIETGTECASVSCSGTGQGPICSVAPLALDFGFVTIGQYEDLGFSVTNTGGGRLTGSVAEPCSDFSIVSGGAYDLGRGDSLLVTVRFAPLTTTAAACTISTGASCGSVVCTGTGDRVPHIYALRDVPGDQGGFINVTWDAVPGDNRTEHVITRYTVWRAIEPTAAELSSLAPGSFIERISDLAPAVRKDVIRLDLAGSLKYYWKLISSLDAYYLEGYSEVVPTLFDSTVVCTEYHYVQIIAHTSDPYTFWVSPSDSGRSADNLAPEEPLRLAGEQSFSPEGLALTWKPNVEADLGHYAVYRGTSASFVPGPGNLIASPPDTTAFDGDWRWSGGYYYKVSAVDVHGNESGYALLTPEEITGGGPPKAPAATYLSQNFPNPFNPMTKIEFGLMSPATVRLRIYDAAGRLVRALEEGRLPAGRYTKTWDGRDGSGGSVSSGVYFYRLDAGSFTQTKKMVLLK